MTVQTVKLGRRRFVILPEKDFRQLKAAQSRTKPPKRRMTAQDRSDIAVAKCREREPARPYAELRKELGLA